MSLLIIEDDPDVILSLSLALNKVGFKIDTATNGLAGLDLARSHKYELIILDCNLPGLSGPNIAKQLRAEKCSTPIIILSVINEIDNKVELLNLGVDDYLIKPFSISELLARIHALLRRPPLQCSDTITVGKLELNHDKFRITKNGVHIPFSAREFSLLEYLMKNKGIFISRQKIMEELWDENADPFSNTIEVHIRNIRKKIETEKEHYIFTASNRGYKVDLER